MDRKQINGRISPSRSANSGGAAARPASPPLQPNYTSRAVQEALEHLASIDLIELCSEAKVERCRATRDLRSCGRYVLYVLSSCGHASLCAECSQRCDVCPVCRIPIPKNENRLRLRLYYECIEAGLISKRYDERFHEKEDGGDSELTADIQRLYTLFDVAMENKLVSLICRYVTDVCMDENAVSSDPVIAFLLDEVVVKDWCKRTFRNIVSELQGIYNLEADEMKTRLHSLLKLSVHLAGISNVLEVLESSFKGSLSAQLHDLQLLQESVLKTKQHLEIMTWCIRHRFLEDVKSRHADIKSWHSVVRERKMTAIKRSWPDVVNQSSGPTMQAGSLFIEDALANLDVEQAHIREMEEDFDLQSLQERGTFFRSNIEGMIGCYPFESLRAAVDVLFLHGSSDLVVAKQAILLYYFFDRHWTLADGSWRNIVDDFATTFGIARNSLLESLTFYLLDDHTDEALQEACALLPEISGPSTHPKISQVLLERGIPETALMVLRWSGRDGSHMVSLSEAVTAVRVRVECGFLTEAFMHQRMLCTKKKMKGGTSGGVSDDLGESRTWEEWVEILVTEICCLCIKRNLVDRMIELPWNMDEEKFIHKCLLDCAMHDPTTTTGSFLLVFYLQRYRYVEAYHVDHKLQSLEEDFILKNPISEEVLSRMRSASHWRARLVVKSIELLPQVRQQEVKTGKLQHEISISGLGVEMPSKSDVPKIQEPQFSSLFVPSSANSSLVLQTDHTIPFKSSDLETPTRFGESFNKPHFELGYGSPSVLHERLFTNAETKLLPKVSINKKFKFDSTTTPVVHRARPISATPTREISRTSLKVHPTLHLYDDQFNKLSPEMEQNGFTKQLQNSSRPISSRHSHNPAALSASNRGFPNDSVQDLWSNMSSEKVHLFGDDRSCNVNPVDEQMDIAWSEKEKVFAGDARYVNGGPRWRSDETSDEDEEYSPGGAIGIASSATPARRIQRSRFSRR